VTERVVANNIEIAYDTFGSRLGRPLVLIMGLGVQMIGWREELCLRLASTGHYVIRFDNRDVGLSTHLSDAPKVDLQASFAGDHSRTSYCLKDMALDVTSLMDALRMPSAHLVGLSMGGMIAQTVAIQDPSRVTSLVSIMSTTGDPSVGRSTPSALAALLGPAATSRESAIRRALMIYETIGSPRYPTDFDRLAEQAGRAFDRSFDPEGVARQFAAIIASGDRTEDLRRVDAPCLVIHGEDDPLVGFDGGEATAAAVPGASLLAFPGMGHDLPEALWPLIVDAISRHTSSAQAMRQKRR
jgi:pimeloyl-ACP methyl ester carboxylesterase